MHKEDQQATSGLTSLGVTSEERDNPQLISSILAFNLNKPIFSSSFIIHPGSASGYDALAYSTAEADPGLFAPNDSIPQQQGMDEGTKNTSFDHISADMDSPEDDPIIVVDDSDEDKEADKDEVHNTTNDEIEEASVPKSSYPRSSQIQELTNQVLMLQSQKHKLNELLVIASKKTKDDSVPSAGQAGTQKDKGKKALPLEEAEKESSDSDYDDDETHVTGSMVESSRIKKTKKFNFVTEDGKHIHLTKEKINQQKKIEEEAKAEAAKRETEDRKEELVDLLGPEVVNKKGPITLKVYREDGTSEIIPNLKGSDLHIGEWREVMNACPNRIGKEWTTIYDQICLKMDYIHTTEVELDLKDFPNTMLYTVQEIFFRRHQGPGLDDHARTFSSLLLAEVDKRNINPLKQMRTIEQLRQ
ncbi:hypothetical protein Tco_0412640 [Tanacetum coccineum]